MSNQNQNKDEHTNALSARISQHIKDELYAYSKEILGWEDLSPGAKDKLRGNLIQDAKAISLTFLNSSPLFGLDLKKIQYHLDELDGIDVKLEYLNTLERKLRYFDVAGHTREEKDFWQRHGQRGVPITVTSIKNSPQDIRDWIKAERDTLSNQINNKSENEPKKTPKNQSNKPGNPNFIANKKEVTEDMIAVARKLYHKNPQDFMPDTGKKTASQNTCLELKYQSPEGWGKMKSETTVARHVEEHWEEITKVQ